VKRITRALSDKHEFAENFCAWCGTRARRPGQLLLPAVLAVTNSATAWERRVTLSLPKMFAR